MSLVLESTIRRVRCVSACAREAFLKAAFGRNRKAIGWVTAGALTSRQPSCLGCLNGAVGMRVANNAQWLNQAAGEFWNEIYRRDNRYAVVVFSKAMDAASQAEAARLRSVGTRVVFDANVNYYEIWGEYDVVDTRPSTAQQQDAISMTRMADHVVGDSSYITAIARKHNPRVTWIPDNVDPRVFRGRRAHSHTRPVRLVWSGVSKKAQHLLMIGDVLSRLRGAELVLVSDQVPPAAADLGKLIPVQFVRYSDRAYARTLRGCDIIISPKRLINAYEMGHTEYKITLGMAVGLPAVASPQPSYVEAISYAGGGILAETSEQWQAALQGLIDDPGLRADLGEKAARTVSERYTTRVTGEAYRQVLNELCQ